MSFSRMCARFVSDKWDDYQTFRIRRDLRKQISREQGFAEACKWGKLTIDEKQSVDDYYRTNYGKPVGYKWHEFFKGVNGVFDKTYLPKPQYFAEFERFENLLTDVIDVLEDKNFFPLAAKGIGVRVPRMLLNCTFGVYRDENNKFINRTEVERYLNKCGEVVIKPSVGSCGGQNIVLVCFKDGVDQYSGNSLENILDKYGDNFVVQERLRSHESLRKIYPESINNFRVVSYRWRDEIRICPAYLRIGQGGSFVDNISSGGFGVGIDGNGVLIGAGLNEYTWKRVERHPDTGLILKGYTIPGFVKITDAVKRMHENISQMGCCNWDFTLDEDEEPVVIEANLVNGGGPASSQMIHAKGVFGEHTAEILHWLRLMKETPLSKRKQYMFGYGM